jgi:UDP-N-acetylglucosamine--N-acetylmuramyl-(pentapeptide) pyrophosphoryl-undecaprenol N-acetylglucosamine transferase
VDDHQTYNGRFLEQGAAAQLIAQTVLNPSMLADIIIDLSRNRHKVKAMAQAAKGLSKPDALEKVVAHCIEVSKT